MKVTSRSQAWEEVNKIFPTDYEKDEASSQRAGYDIYRHPTLNYYNRICDLGCRLEVLTGEYGETVVNIWIVEEEAQHDAERKANATESETTTALPAYGTMLAEKIRTETTDFSKLTAFEKFALDSGYKFKTEEALRAGYDRAWKCSRDILLTEDEFAAEAGLGISTFSQWNEDAAREVYNVLAGFAKAGKITAAEVYRYAHYKWCLRKPEAIVAKQGQEKSVPPFPASLQYSSFDVDSGHKRRRRRGQETGTKGVTAWREEKSLNYSSNYKRQSEAVENSRKKLALLTEEHEKLQREMSQTETPSDSLKKKFERNEKQIAATTDKITEQEQMGRRFKHLSKTDRFKIEAL